MRTESARGVHAAAGEGALREDARHHRQPDSQRRRVLGRCRPRPPPSAPTPVPLQRPAPRAPAPCAGRPGICCCLRSCSRSPAPCPRLPVWGSPPAAALAQTAPRGRTRRRRRLTSGLVDGGGEEDVDEREGADKLEEEDLRGKGFEQGDGDTSLTCAAAGTWKGWEREREPVVVKGVSSIAGGSASLSAIAPVMAPRTCEIPQMKTADIYVSCYKRNNKLKSKA